MIEKAKENLEAARQLFAAGLMNAAASRAYYSAYHACWWVLDGADRAPDRNKDGNRFWGHTTIAEQACLYGPRGFSGELRDQYNEILYQERLLADYYPEDSDSYNVQECIEIAEQIRETIGEGGDE